MESYEKNKQLHIDKEALYSLALVQEGLLYPIIKHKSQHTLEVDSKSNYSDFRTPFMLNPAGKKNQEVLKQAKIGDKLDIVFENKVVGYIKAQEIFEVNNKQRANELSNGQKTTFERIHKRLGKYAVYGDYHVDFKDIKQAKANLAQKIAHYNAKIITAIVLDGEVLHRGYEKLIRDGLGDSDLVVVFLLKPYEDNLIDYTLREKCLHYAMKNFLINDRICIIPLDDTYLFLGPNKVLLHAVVAKNYGCTKFMLNQDTPNLSMFYDKNMPHSVLDNLKDIQSQIKGDYVFCNTCKMLVDTKTCPHGHHQHIRYDLDSILEFYRLGLLPPALLVRPGISAIILSHLYPNRFTNLQKIYYNLMPLDDGILTPKSEEDFYKDLMRLYQMSSLT